MIQNHQNINADGGSDEYYTPPEIVEAARRTLGEIDLDPASSPVANERVRANRIFTVEDDGLNRHWGGRVWMNHPFGRMTNRPWIARLAGEYAAGRVTEAVCITFAATSEQWFKPLLQMPQCYLNGRTNYFLPDGTLKKGVTKGSVVTYFGKNVENFAREFRALGTIKVAI
jgi:ParB family chromosome partitioning protein